MDNLPNPRSPNKFSIVACILFVFWYLLLYDFDWSFLPALSSLSRDAVIAPHLNEPNLDLSEKDQKSVDEHLNESNLDPSEKDQKSTDEHLNESNLDPSEKDQTSDEEHLKKSNLDPSNDQKSTDGLLSESNLDPSEKDKKSVGDSPCRGRYIYISDIPNRFNLDYIKQCKKLNKWEDMCKYFANGGLGQRLRDGWFVTSQFSLEVIFHNRMKRYECLTNDSSKAAAVYVPYFPGLDVSRYLWAEEVSRKDDDSVDVFKLLRSRPEWGVMNGKDHFLVSGRITWDLRRVGENLSDWGSRVMIMPESMNMTMLTIESSPWHKNDFAVPYPTYFHPSTSSEVEEWQNKMRKQKRRSLFCFTGGPRPNMSESIRNKIISQCAAARNSCRMMECGNDNKHNCLNPTNVMKMFQNSIFCLQPSGDSFTRRSTFDSILAGCIPVFFTPASFYVQYLWHLPRDHSSYSVLIPEADVKAGNVSIERVLSRVSRERAAEMRENVIKMIPRLIYADPGRRVEKIDDAFELTVKGVLERVEGLRKWRDESGEFDEEFSWKHYTFGHTQPHEWDSYFARH